MAWQWHKDFLSGWMALTAIWAALIVAAVGIESVLSPDDRLLWNWIAGPGWAVLLAPSLALFGLGVLVCWLIGDVQPSPVSVRIDDR